MPNLAVPSDFPSISDSNSFETLYWMYDGWRFIATEFAFQFKTANYTAQLSDYILAVDCTAGAVTITLPAHTSCVGKTIIISKYDTSTNDITVQASDSTNIYLWDSTGAATQTIASNEAVGADGAKAGQSRSFVATHGGWMMTSKVQGYWYNSGDSRMRD